ncbi:hypothetical protein SAMN05444287_1348 [Octadecabacter temperatus]|uniref:Uncharacterized protein n=1 Tax=Octadecabacter temperatus TaxID=1458307 RepID=A0A0K0Y5J8_9RHOB|nr:hypothetical protein [Octadecabacter temperatus]AKS46239.1 hypothetical protein OSB_16910 [Octadecabacter temperatus]SIO10313.1 hypothetical protein SAMN05444287_1348 [Octadecabacter temperatus]
MDTTYNEHLTRLAERHLENKLRNSWIMVAIGFASAVAFLTWSYVEFSRLGYLPVLGILFSGFILAGGTPQFFRQMRTIASSPVHASHSYQDQQNSIRHGLVAQELESSAIRTLQRKLKIAFIVRMLGVLALLSLYPIATILADDGTRGSYKHNHVTGEVLISYDGREWYGLGP